MKLSTRLFISFLLIIILPLALSAIMMFGVVGLRAHEIRARYGIDVSNLDPEMRSFIAAALFDPSGRRVRYHPSSRGSRKTRTASSSARIRPAQSVTFADFAIFIVTASLHLPS